MGVTLHAEYRDHGLHWRSDFVDGTVQFWLRDNQPCALQNSAEREKLFTFEVDILGNDRCDLSLNLKLTERVIAREVDSVMQVEAVPEPEQPGEYWASHQHG